MLKKDSSFIQEKGSVRMDGTAAGVNSSAWEIDLNQLAIKEDLMQAVEWQLMAGTDLNEHQQSGSQFPQSAKPKESSINGNQIKAPF